MKNRILMGFAALAIVAFLSSCSKVPQEQIDGAKAAIETAKAAQADVYLPAEFAALQDSLTATMAAIEVQNSKLFKKFGPAKLQLEAIVASAAQVSENAVATKELVRVEAETLLAELNTLIAQNKELMLKAPKGKGGAAVLEEIKNEMAVIEESFVEASTLFANGEFMSAKDKATAAKENALAIQTELTDAIAKVKR
ncbi:MAG: hypothetical protein Q8M23_06970 [Bacteroidales bacterium]|nr:hypothetical protein [Bacteroidales bacterium]